jgi:hypothetical protein
MRLPPFLRSFLLVLLISCSCSMIKSQSFKVAGATQQRWAGGVRGSGTGINYEITLIAKQASSKMSIDQLWVGNQFYEVKAGKKFTGPAPFDFKPNDTIYINATQLFPGERMPDDPDTGPEFIDIVPVNTPPPYKYKGAALIGYKLNGKRKYMPIAKIDQLPNLDYP